MTNKELEKFMKDNKLTEASLAEVLGVTKGAVSHWVAGIRGINEPVRKLITLMKDTPEDIQYVRGL